jgi:hypothetical protein
LQFLSHLKISRVQVVRVYVVYILGMTTVLVR